MTRLTAGGLAALATDPPRLSARQRRVAHVLEEALYAAGDPMPQTHAVLVAGGPHWLRLLGALRCLDDEQEEAAGDGDR